MHPSSAPSSTSLALLWCWSQRHSPMNFLHTNLFQSLCPRGCDLRKHCCKFSVIYGQGELNNMRNKLGTGSLSDNSQRKWLRRTGWIVLRDKKNVVGLSFPDGGKTPCWDCSQKRIRAMVGEIEGSGQEFYMRQCSRRGHLVCPTSSRPTFLF